MTEPRMFTREEVAARNHLNNAAIIIDNVVYDVTEFLEQHPGGAEVLMDNAGKDASRCFRDVGHSETALEWRQRYVAGEVVPHEHWEVLAASALAQDPPDPLTLASLLSVWGPPLGMAALAVLIYIYLFP